MSLAAKLPNVPAGARTPTEQSRLEFQRKSYVEAVCMLDACPNIRNGVVNFMRELINFAPMVSSGDQAKIDEMTQSMGLLPQIAAPPSESLAAIQHEAKDNDNEMGDTTITVAADTEAQRVAARVPAHALHAHIM